MEVKNSAASRSRVFVAVLALGVIAGALGFFGHSRTPKTLSDGSQISPGSAPVEELGSETRALPGISLVAKGQNVSAPGVQKVLVAKPSQTQLQTAWKQSTIRMKYLDHCAQTLKCAGFDEATPASYDLDVHQQTAREIEDFTQITKVWTETRGGDVPAEAQTIARYFLKTGNDDVKDAAIRLIDLAKPTPENMQAVVAAVEHSSSGPLMKVYLKSEMVKSCSEAAMAPACVHIVKRTAQRGSDGMQKALARHSLAITTPQTLRALAEFERNESPRSKTRYYLRLNREEYQRFQRGG